jgi:hypothetical protein
MTINKYDKYINDDLMLRLNKSKGSIYKFDRHDYKYPEFDNNEFKKVTDKYYTEAVETRTVKLGKGLLFADYVLVGECGIDDNFFIAHKKEMLEKAGIKSLFARMFMEEKE